MDSIIDRAALRMERRLPSGTPTGWLVYLFIPAVCTVDMLWSRRHKATFHCTTLLKFSSALSVSKSSSTLPVLIVLFSRMGAPFLDSMRVALGELVHTLRCLVTLLYLTLSKMGADPIVNSVYRWHGCHHSNQGGKIQCQ